MNPSKLKHEEDERVLEDFLKLRPTRAIDRMLGENPVERVFGLYGQLQEKIRKNTTELRSTLTDKYQNLVDCSILLTSIQDFTHQIEAIEKNISHIFHQNPLKSQQEEGRKQNSLVNRIEEKVYQRQFSQAMRMSHSEAQHQLEDNEKLYLPFLRIQILQSLENELITKKMSQQFIVEIISCLDAYIKKLSPSEKAEIVKNSHDLEEGTLLSLLASYLQEEEGKKGKEGKELTEGDILEIVFKCKLFSLNRPQKGLKEEDKISKFFHDIYQLIGEKGRSSTEINRLAQIFCQNLTQIESHLSETFIVSNQNQIISFRYDLYHNLLSSQDFMLILDSLHATIAEHYPQTPKTTLRESFLNLWNNYYGQLLDLLFKRCDPASKLGETQSLEDSDTQTNHIPAEILKYFVPNIQIEEHIQSYQSELSLLVQNIKSLLSKTEELGKNGTDESQIMESIKVAILGKVKEINERIKDKSAQLFKQPSEKNLHQLFLLFFYCQEFNSALGKEASCNYITELPGSKLEWDEHTVKHFSSIFHQQKQQDWSISFDRFFMHYNPSFLTGAKLAIVKTAILLIIEGMMENKDPQRAAVLIGENRSKKIKEEQEALNKKNRLQDMPASSQSAATFVKKKGKGKA